MTNPVNISDVVITGHKTDMPFVKRLAESLQSVNLNVWYGNQSLDEAGAVQRKSQAILGCKIYVPVLSKESVQEKTFNDELALAYISNSAVFPVGLKSFPEISSNLDGGSKLILARINWVFVLENSEYETSIKNLIRSINQQMKLINSQDPSETIGSSGYIQTHGMIINTQFSHLPDRKEANDILSTPSSADMSPSQKSSKTMSLDFWERHFPKKTEVKWTEFKEKFQQDYNNRITELYSVEKQMLFQNLMYRDIFNLNKTIQRSVYDKFCNLNVHADPHCFFNMLQEYVIAHISLRKVFNMNSTLRITTIQNLGKFSFPAIVQGLTDMLKDEDPNIRAVAAIALAKSGKNRLDTVDKLVGLLEDEDRLVRESSLLSLGYLKATKAVQHVVNRWRNDPISTVREAASLALKRMNIEEAQTCIKVTEVLSKEMAALKPQ